MKTEYNTNKYQTQLTDELLNSLNREVRGELIDTIENIKFVKWLISPEGVRGFARTRPKDETGKIIVDITKPHILEDMDFFRERAIHFDKYGCYTKLHPNSNPKSDYSLFWKEETRRWREGLIRPSDGEWIPGLYYFYLNYSPIWINQEENVSDKTAKVKGKRVRKFPSIWLGDYLWFHYMDQARNSGAHCKLLKKRGCGFSFKFGAITPCTMYTEPGLPNFHLASDKTFLEGDKGVFGKVIDVLDWIGETTPLPKLRLVDKPLEKQIGYKDEYGARKGLKSSVFGISMKDNPDKARGIRGPIIHYEEDGLFPNLENAWNVNREAVEDGGIVFGTMIAGGCVCAGTKVWTNEGEIKNIEDVYTKQENGILGYDGNGTFKEDIEWFKLPEKKKCYKISTSGNNYIECSEDHPLLKSYSHWREEKTINKKRTHKKLVTFELAKDLKVGDQLALIDEVPIFGDKAEPYARFLGLMIGDGNCTTGSTPQLSCSEDEIFEYITKLFDHYSISKKFKMKSNNRFYRSIGLSTSISILKEHGIYGKVHLDKTLPIDVHTYNKESLAELIGGYFDADGNITYNKKRDRYRLCLTSISENLLSSVKYQLVKFGIHGNIQKELRKDGYKPNTFIYRLYIEGQEDILRFKNNIKLLSKTKQERLNSIINTIDKADRRRKISKFILNPINNKGHYFIGKENMQQLYFESITNIEYIGEKIIYNLHTKTTNTYLSNMYITKQTGGTEGADFAGSEKLFYNTVSHNIYGVPNVFDKNVNENNKCGFFWGAYLNRSRHYNTQSGEPDVVGALIEIIKERYEIKYHSTDPNTITQKKAEQPITPQEAIMRRDGTIFPVADLKDYLAEVMPSLKSFIKPHYVGRLIINTAGNVEFVEDPKLNPIRDYPLTDNLNREGAVEIFEKPQYYADNKIEAFRYISGADVVDDDDNVTTDSLPSIFIYDRYTDRIVAEYTGRPRTANEFYEIARRLIMYYGATCNYENNKKGMFAYFENHHSTHLLCDNPSILDEKGIANTKGNFGNKKKGTNASPSVNAWGRRLQADWMISPAYGSENEGKLNLHKIRSIGYLKEAIAWNADGNFDRVSAMIMLMIYREEVAKMEIRRTKDRVKEQFNDPWWDKHFKQNKKQFML